MHGANFALATPPTSGRRRRLLGLLDCLLLDLLLGGRVVLVTFVVVVTGKRIVQILVLVNITLFVALLGRTLQKYGEENMSQLTTAAVQRKAFVC